MNQTAVRLNEIENTLATAKKELDTVKWKSLKAGKLLKSMTKAYVKDVEYVLELLADYCTRYQKFSDLEVRIKAAEAKLQTYSRPGLDV